MSLPLGKDPEFDDLLEALAAPAPVSRAEEELFTPEWWRRYGNQAPMWPSPATQIHVPGSIPQAIWTNVQTYSANSTRPGLYTGGNVVS